MSGKRLIKTLNQRRWTILGVWLLGLVFNISLLYYADTTQFAVSSAPENLREPISKLETDYWTTYGVYLTTMLSICFARTNNSPIEDSTSKAPFWIALVISVLWNVFLFIQTAELVLRHAIDVQTLTDLVQSFVQPSAFLVSPFIAYFFSSETAK